jgi:RNA polymerase sigma-70 factor (ECF subfamily)
MALPASSAESDAARAAAHETAQDALLIERVRRGDAEAFGELVQRHSRRAFSIAYRLLQQREDAEDVVQDAFIRALEHMHTLERGRPFRPWFHRIVVNHALNFRRSRSIRTTEAIPVDTRALGALPDRDAERAALRDRLTIALEQLPEKQRTIVQLADLEEFTSGEIAAIMDMPDGTVRWHLHQARRTLRQALGMLKEDE